MSGFTVSWRRLAAALTVLVVAPFLAVVATVAPASALPAVYPGNENAQLCRLNDIRRAHGLAPVAFDETVARQSREWSRYMAESGRFAHDPNFGTKLFSVRPTAKHGGENLGKYQSDAEVMDAFMLSPGHRANILNPSFRSVGIGVWRASDGTFRTTHRFHDVPMSNPNYGSCTPSVPEFTDVPANAYYATAVRWLSQRGVTTGCGTKLFCPTSNVTRAEVVTFLWRMAGKPSSPSGKAFSDVPSGSYYAQATRWARAVGLTTGVGGTNFFEPSRGMTRAEFVTMLHRFAGQPDRGSSHGFVDGVPGWAAKAVTWAKYHKITTGIAGTNRFEPGSSVIRAQAATFLYRYATTPAAAGSKAIRIRV